MDGSAFYRNDRSSSGSSVNRRTPLTSNSNSRSASSESSDETPLLKRRRDNAMASSISACQEQLSNVLKKLEETTETLATLAERVERVEQKVTEFVDDGNDKLSQKASSKGKRKRPRDSLTIQDEVHKLHANREERNQYKGLQSVNSPHNKVVTDYITKQLKAKGHDEIKVERAAKKFHEHIRRVAQGKVDDDVKARMRMANRKSRKFLQRKRCLDPEKEKEVGAFNALSKDHMSSDEEDPHDKNQWLSRPPTYRSETLQRFLNKLDKAHNKRASKEAKFAKKIKRVVGEPKEVDPPENTPVWALSRTWLEHRERSMNQVNQDSAEVDQQEIDESDHECESESEESDLDFEE